MPQHGPPGDRHGLFGKLVQGGRRIGRGLLAKANEPMLLPGDEGFSREEFTEQARRTAGEFGFPGDIAAARSIPGLLGEGRPGQAALAALSLIPGVPRLGLFGKAAEAGRTAARGSRIPRIFEGMESLRGSGLRVYARAEGPGVRTVFSITPNPKPGGAVKVTIFDDTAEQGFALRNTVDFASMEEAIEAVESGRGFWRGVEKIPVGPENVMESRFGRIEERGLLGTPSQTRTRAETREAPL